MHPALLIVYALYRDIPFCSDLFFTQSLLHFMMWRHCDRDYRQKHLTLVVGVIL